MPLEIRELVIKASISEGGQEQSGVPSSSGGSQEAIIAACVEQVLAVLKEKAER
jgi:hypothetical protein